MNLIERVNLTQNTLQEYLGKPFAWGNRDCSTVAAFVANAAGHDTPNPRGYKTAAGALRAIRKLGHKDLEALIDSLFERIPPASALPADLIALPAEKGWIALGVCLGEQRILAFVDHADGQGEVASIGPITVATHAWRVTGKVAE